MPWFDPIPLPSVEQLGCGHGDDPARKSLSVLIPRLAATPAGSVPSVPPSQFANPARSGFAVSVRGAGSRRDGVKAVINKPEVGWRERGSPCSMKVMVELCWGGGGMFGGGHAGAVPPQTWGKVGLWIIFVLRSFQSSPGEAGSLVISRDH